MLENSNNETNNNLIVINQNELMSTNNNNSDNQNNSYNNKSSWDAEFEKCDKVNIEEKIKDYVIRVERLDEEISEINNQKNDLFKEMKEKNICVEAIKEIVKERKKDPAVVEIVNLNKEQYKNYLI